MIKGISQIGFNVRQFSNMNKNQVFWPITICYNSFNITLTWFWIQRYNFAIKQNRKNHEKKITPLFRAVKHDN